jgi:hypothetical protein
MCLVVAVLAIGSAAQASIVTYSIQSDGIIGHEFYPGYYDDWEERTYPAYTVDRLAFSYEEGPALPAFTGTLVGGDTMEITFSAPTGSVFAVNPIAGGITSFSLYLMSSNGSSYPYVLPTGSFEWIGSTGTVPSISTEYTEFALGSQTFSIYADGEVTAPFSFTGFKCTVQVPDGFSQTYDNLTWAYGFVGFECNGGSDSAIVSVPEPATMAILGLGALGLLRRKK